MRFNPRPHAGRRYHKQSRTLPIHGNSIMGDGKDDGKYYRCWNCGFICNQERDALGGPESKSGAGHQIFDQKYSTDGSPVPFFSASIHGVADDGEALVKKCVLYTGHVVLENGPDSLPKGIYVNWMSDISSGCPFCGSLNWRGDY